MQLYAQMPIQPDWEKRFEDYLIADSEYQDAFSAATQADRTKEDLEVFARARERFLECEKRLFDSVGT